MTEPTIDCVPSFVFRQHTCPVHSVKFLEGDLYMASGDAKGNLIVWDMLLKKPLINRAGAHVNAIISIDGAPGNLVVTQGRDNLIKLWQLVDDGSTVSLEERQQ